MFDDVTCRRLYPITLFPHIEEGVGLVAVEDVFVCFLLSRRGWGWLLLMVLCLFPPIQEGVGLVAVNDALWIEGTIYKILRQHFRSEPYYVNILELFHEVRPHPLRLNFVSYICQCNI